MYFIGKKPHIPRPCPTKMQAKYPKDFFHFAPDPRKNPVQLLLFLRKGLASTFLVQNPTKCPLLAASLAYRLAIVGLVRKNGLFLSFNQLLKDLRIMHVSRCADKLCHKLRLRINGYMILVAIDGLFPFLVKEASESLPGLLAALTRRASMIFPVLSSKPLLASWRLSSLKHSR